MSKVEGKNALAQKISEYLIYLPLAWIALVMFWLDKGDKILLIIVALCSLISLAINKIQVMKKNWQDQPWIKWILALILFGLISDTIHGFGSRELRALETSLLVLLFLDTSKLKWNFITTLLLIATLTSAATAFYFQYIDVTDRRLWPVNAIPFASYVTLLIGISFTLLIYARTKISILVLGSAVVIGFGALLLTQSRGPLLSLICATLIIGAFKVRSGLTNWKIVATLTALLVGVLFLSKPIVENRYNQTIIELNKISQGNYESSTGARFKVYQIGLELIKDKPIWGYGKEDLSTRWDKMKKDGEINWLVHQVLSWNFHNNFIEKGVASGLVGIATMFLWLGMPIVYGWRQYREHLPLIAMPPLLYFFACLTDTPATNGSSYVTYLIFVGLILASVKRCSDEKNSTNKEPSLA